MTIDASIPLQARVAQIEPDMNRLARALAIQSAISQNTAAQMSIEDSQAARVRQQELRDILSRGGSEADLLRGGFVDQALAMRKADLEGRKTAAEIRVKELEAARKTLDAGLQAGASLLSAREPLSKQSVLTALTPHVQAGAVDMSFATKFVQGLPDDDAGIRAALKRGMLSSMSAKEQLEAMLPKVQMQDVGGQVVPYNTNPASNEPLGPIAGAPVLTKGMTPGETASNSVARDRLAWDKQQPVIVPGVGAYNRTQGGLAPITDTSGAPVRALTDAEKEAQKRSTAAGRVIDVLDNAAVAPDGTAIPIEDLIKASTGSYAGWTRDQILRIGGYATDGSKAGARLKVIQPTIMLAQPRMEGPQSDRDVNLYREAAAQVGDTTVPVEERLLAVATLRRLQGEYAPGGAKYTPPRGPGAAAPAAAPAAPQEDGVRARGGTVKYPGAAPQPAAPAPSIPVPGFPGFTITPVPSR